MMNRFGGRGGNDVRWVHCREGTIRIMPLAGGRFLVSVKDYLRGTPVDAQDLHYTIEDLVKELGGRVFGESRRVDEPTAKQVIESFRNSESIRR